MRPRLLPLDAVGFYSVVWSLVQQAKRARGADRNACGALDRAGHRRLECRLPRRTSMHRGRMGRHGCGAARSAAAALPPRLPQRVTGELVSGPRNRAGQRRSRQRPQRARRPSRRAKAHASVVDAHQRLCPTPARRPRRFELERQHQRVTAPLDRPQSRCADTV